MPSVGQIAGVILQDKDQKYLLIQEAYATVRGLWNIPAGHVDDGETPMAAAIREAAEETGIVVTLVSDKPTHTHFNSDKNKQYFAFKAELVGGVLKVNPSEILDASWFSIEEIHQMNKDHKIREPWIYEALCEDAK